MTSDEKRAYHDPNWRPYVIVRDGVVQKWHDNTLLQRTHPQATSLENAQCWRCEQALRPPVDVLDVVEKALVYALHGVDLSGVGVTVGEVQTMLEEALRHVRDAQNSWFLQERTQSARRPNPSQPVMIRHWPGKCIFCRKRVYVYYRTSGHWMAVCDDCLATLQTVQLPQEPDDHQLFHEEEGDHE